MKLPNAEAAVVERAKNLLTSREAISGWTRSWWRGGCRSRNCGTLRVGTPAATSPSTEVALRALEPGVFFQQIAVGHAGDVVAYGPVETFALDPPGRGFAQQSRGAD